MKIWETSHLPMFPKNRSYARCNVAHFPMNLLFLIFLRLIKAKLFLRSLPVFLENTRQLGLSTIQSMHTEINIGKVCLDSPCAFV